jgi:hypothetical protein
MGSRREIDMRSLTPWLVCTLGLLVPACDQADGSSDADVDADADADRDRDPDAEQDLDGRADGGVPAICIGRQGIADAEEAEPIGTSEASFAAEVAADGVVLTTTYGGEQPREARSVGGEPIDITGATFVGQVLVAQYMESRLAGTEVESRPLSALIPAFATEPEQAWALPLPPAVTDEYEWASMDLGWIRVFEAASSDLFYQWSQAGVGPVCQSPPHVASSGAFTTYYPLPEDHAHALPAERDSWDYVAWIRAALGR